MRESKSKTNITTATANDKVLVINAGSSTFKCALFERGDDAKDPVLIWSGSVDYIQNQAEKTLKSLLQPILKHSLNCIGHRVVHGGELFTEPTPITPKVFQQLKKISELAPLHNPSNLLGIELTQNLFPSIPQLAVFDTAFHKTLPESASTYPLPLKWKKEGIRRYGFHGISHAYCLEKCAEILGKKAPSLNLITCHLGNGCSLTAIRKGKSVDTTMGFTPLEGLMMGSRCGSIDPGILLHKSRQGTSYKDLESILNKKSGFEGICGTNDLRKILKLQTEEAALALEMFRLNHLRHFGAMLASLDRLDGVVFTGGIGENSPWIRTETTKAFPWLGMKIHPSLNKKSPPDHIISSNTSKVPVLLIHAREDWVIARFCLEF